MSLFWVGCSRHRGLLAAGRDQAELSHPAFTVTSPVRRYKDGSDRFPDRFFEPDTSSIAWISQRFIQPHKTVDLVAWRQKSKECWIPMPKSWRNVIGVLNMAMPLFSYFGISVWLVILPNSGMSPIYFGSGLSWFYLWLVISTPFICRLNGSNQLLVGHQQ